MPFCAPPRRAPLVRLLLPAVWLLLITSTASAREPVKAQRAAFKQAYAAAQQGGDAWRSLAAGLKDYPLYPYLQAASLEHDIRQIDIGTVNAYLKRYPHWIPAGDLRRHFLGELARRQDWADFQTLYVPGLGAALSCDALQARMAAGKKLKFSADLAALWAKPSLPSACDPVLNAAHDQGLLTSTRLWARIEHAAQDKHAGTVASLAGWLPKEQRAQAMALVQALRDPSAAARAAANWPDTPRYREAVVLALSRLARRDSTQADDAWGKLKQRFDFSASARDRVLQVLALFNATDFTDDALSRLVALPAAAQSDATREWRVRVALVRQDWPAVLAAIDAMPLEQRQDGEWRYFHARALAETGQHTAARRQFNILADQATFYGFLAADRLDQPYAICPLSLADNPEGSKLLQQNSGLQRAFELYAVDLPRLARREWNRALKGADQTTRRLAVDLANRKGWYDRAIFALSHGEALRLYRLRFPLASQDGVVPQAEEAGIEPAWAYGLLRAESAWMSDARSAADARGLMQLLPQTAALVARQNGMVWGGGDTLYDPTVNIALGTRYLAQMSARFGGSPWLASAAYNAGPNRVDQWLQSRGTLPPDLFIATMPFKETREYVARVMAFSVIYDWRLHGSVTAMSSRLNAIGTAYTPPTTLSPRKSVQCPVIAETAHAPAKHSRNNPPAAASL
ncbi:MAG: lytic murein transglycosylase [Rhodanobacter sp.]|nr:MAG: lytic murein transglycosylase [Rhodanobacter sp.]